MANNAGGYISNDSLRGRSESLVREYSNPVRNTWLVDTVLSSNDEMLAQQCVRLGQVCSDVPFPCCGAATCESLDTSDPNMYCVVKARL